MGEQQNEQGRIQKVCSICRGTGLGYFDCYCHMAGTKAMSGSTCTVECWGCRKSETHPIVHGEQYDKLMADMAARGWRRRAFWSPNWDKGPWFCSEDCATNSHNAKQAQAYWEEQGQKEFEKYCRETKINRGLWMFGVLLLALFSTFALGECICARLQ